MIINRFETHVNHHPDKLAVKTEKRALTYSQLNKLSKQIASRIKSMTNGADGKTIGVFLEEPAEVLAAIFGVLRSGNIYVPLVSDFPVKRLSYIMNHAALALIVTDHKNILAVSEACEGNRQVPCIIVQDIEKENNPVPENEVREIFTDRGASLLYTSGSTGTPKGVLQYHRNILYFIDRYTENLNITSDDRLTLFASFSHDVTLIDMYSALMNGATSYPLDLKQSGVFSSLIQWLKDEKITIWHSVPTVFRYFAATLPEDAKLDLPDLRYVVLGGESVLKSDIQRFQALFSNFPEARMYLLYGQTESSYDSGQAFKVGDPIENLTLGEPNKGTQMIIVDEEGNEVEPLEVGEIIIVGQHISPGYWNDKEKTDAKFFDHPEDGRIYFTGDLGRQLLNGRIEFLGRKDNQIKLRGYRIELEEIERVLMQHEKIVETAVVAIETNPGEKFIACYFVANGDTEFSVIRQYLSERLPDYMIPTYYRQLLRLPTTVSGKVDKQSLPAPEVNPMHEYVPPETELERKLVELWAEVLLLGKEIIGIDSSFFEMGGHSLRATALIAKIRKYLNVNFPLSEIFVRQTIREQAEFISQQQTNTYYAIPPAEKKAYYAATIEQRRFYRTQTANPKSIMLNLPYFFIFDFPLNPDAVAEITRQIAIRHDILRTSFAVIDGEIVQVVHEPENVKVDFTYEEISTGEESAFLNRFIRPFDLSQYPLFRTGVAKIDNRYMICVDLHHSIADNTTLNLFEGDFMALAQGTPQPIQKIQFKDYAEWQNGPYYKALLEKQKAFWLKTLEGELPVITLPYDFPRPPQRSFEGRSFMTLLGMKENVDAKKFALKNNVTFFMVAFSAFNILISKLSKLDDLLIATPMVIRKNEELQQMFGMLNNTLPQRNFLPNDKPYLEFLQEVKHRSLEVFENQEFPYDELADIVLPVKDPSRNPLFDVLFNGLDEKLYKGDPAVLAIQDIMFSQKRDARLDLQLIAVDRGDNILLNFTYCVDLFKFETIEKFAEYYKKIMAAIIEHPDWTLGQLKNLPEE